MSEEKKEVVVEKDDVIKAISGFLDRNPTVELATNEIKKAITMACSNDPIFGILMIYAIDALLMKPKEDKK